MHKKVDVVLVTYYPNKELLNNVIKSLFGQIRTIYIIDNTPESIEQNELRIFPNIERISLNENIGIASAQNIGIQKAIKNGADYILLSDQDTLYPDNYVQLMLMPFLIQNNTFAAIAPRFVDINQQDETGFIALSTSCFPRFFPHSGVHNVLQAIASGMILNTCFLKNIGLMDEELFIDWVDLEWCWRARAHGYTILGNADVIITHCLGDSAKNIGFRQVNLRSPTRHYYITRNAFHLALRCTTISRRQRFVLFLKFLRYLVAYPILSKPHLTHLFYVLLGFWHGITKRLGKLQ